MVVVFLGPFDKRDAGVIEENELDRGERTKQFDHLGRSVSVVILVVGPDERQLKPVFSERPYVHLKPVLV